MPPKPQKCSICKKEGHNKLRCPGVGSNESINVLDIDFIKNNQKPVTPVHFDNQRGMIKAIENEKLQELRDNGERTSTEEYFFRNIKNAITTFQTKFLTNRNLTSVILVAPPGSGKTMLMDYIMYVLKTNINDDDCILGDRFSLFTGMSSLDWVTQIKENIIFGQKNFEVYHNPDIYKRINYLIKNPLLLLNHYFLIDELQIACELKHTIGKELKRLGLTPTAIKELNIKFVLISATPDIMLEEFLNSKNDECDIIMVEPGPNYKGFEYFNIDNYKSLDEKINREFLINTIKEKYSSPKYHFIRVKSAKFANKLRAELGNEGWLVKDYDQESNKYLDEKIDSVIKTPPIIHTFWFVKDMFRASKRLRINCNIGAIIEPFNKEDVTVTAQGLIPRWFGYYTPEELLYCDIIFMCNKQAIDKYIKFLKTGKYNGIDYRSRLMNTKKPKPTHQSPYFDQKEEISEFDERFGDSIEIIKSKMENIFGDIPSNNGLNAIHRILDNSLLISTNYCDKIDSSKRWIGHADDPSNYIPITESMLNSKGWGKSLGKGKNDKKLVFIPFYNDQLDVESLQYCCRFYKQD